jgi:hypothetical protein
MLTRREVLGGLLTIGFVSDYARADSRTLGCVVSDRELTGLLGSSPALFKFDIDKDVVFNGSGDKDLDRALAITLAKISDYFNVLPGFAFFDEGLESPNAYASPSHRLGRDDGSVAFGKVLLSRLMKAPDKPELSVASVCSHEFGHILQFKRNLGPRLRGANEGVKRIELHADYLAGYFAGVRKLERPSYPAAYFAQTQANFGDTNYGNPGHHGTPDERGRAVVAGFKAAYEQRKNVSDAIEEGVRFVLAM